MLNAPVYLRLMGLAAGVALVGAGVAYMRTGSAPASKTVASKTVAGRPAPPAALAPPAPEQAPAELPEPPPLPPQAAAPPPPPAAPDPAPAPQNRAAPEDSSDLPPQARAALIERERAPPRAGRLDLNSASVAELNGLRGAGRIGRRIVRSRPYRSPEDLLKKRIVSRAVYARIKDQVRVGP